MDQINTIELEIMLDLLCGQTFSSKNRPLLVATVKKKLKYKCHSIPSIYSCLFIRDNYTTVETGTAQEPSIYVTGFPSMKIGS